MESPIGWLRTETGWIALSHVVELNAVAQDHGFAIYGSSVTGTDFVLLRKFESWHEAERHLDWIVGVPTEEEMQDE